MELGLDDQTGNACRLYLNFVLTRYKILPAAEVATINTLFSVNT
jgi:hypothetical protein